jgi:CDP-paratose 2-epimerase
MAVALITGSAGPIGAEAARFFAEEGFEIVGIDNDMRREFFGEEASTIWSRQRLETTFAGHRHCDIERSERGAQSSPTIRQRRGRRHPYRGPVLA